MMSCGCKQDRAIVERKLQARRDRKKEYELRHELDSQQKLDDKEAAFHEYIKTRQPIGYQDTAGGRIALYDPFVFR